MENETLLSLNEVNTCIDEWNIARQSYETVKVYLSSSKAFTLTRSAYETHLESSNGEYIHAYLGIKDGGLVLIWVPADYNPEDNFVSSLLVQLEEPSYLVDTTTQIETNVIEIGTDLNFTGGNAFSKKDYIGSDNAVPSSEAYMRISNWSKNCLDWAFMTLQNSREIVRVFAIPKNDPDGLFLDPDVTGLKIFMGLYPSAIAGYVIPDLILVGDRSKPTGIIETPRLAVYNEATDLIRPCPPFCNDRGFALL